MEWFTQGSLEGTAWRSEQAIRDRFCFVLHAKRNNIYLCEHHFKSMLILWAQQRSINIRHTLIIIGFVFLCYHYFIPIYSLLHPLLNWTGQIWLGHILHKLWALGLDSVLSTVLALNLSVWTWHVFPLWTPICYSVIPVCCVCEREWLFLCLRHPVQDIRHVLYK